MLGLWQVAPGVAPGPDPLRQAVAAVFVEAWCLHAAEGVLEVGLGQRDWKGLCLIDPPHRQD